MTDHPFSALLELIEFDQGIRRATQEVEQLKQEVSALQIQQENAGQALKVSEDKVIEYCREIKSLELSLKELDAQEAYKKVQLGELSEYREYRALKSEIDVIQCNRLDKEEALLLIINRLEATQKELDLQRSIYDSKVKVLDASINENKKRIDTLIQEIRSNENLRTEKDQCVPVDWRDKYSMMRMRVPDPVVPVLDSSCSSCFQAITSQALIRVKNRALVQCQGCFRLLYLQDSLSEQERSL